MSTRAPVHVWLPGAAEPVLAGEFAHDSRTGSGRFAYDPAYLEARHPALAPDMPLRPRAIQVTRGPGIFPLFLDAGPDAWGRQLLARRLERDVSEFEALRQGPADGVGNLALGELTRERLRILSLGDFVMILGELERGALASSASEAQVLDAAQGGTSLGGTKPKLTLSRDGVLYLAKFPEPTDTRWLPEIECAMLKLATECGIRAAEGEVWQLPGGRRSALLVRRFDRATHDTGVGRIGFVSAHALLRVELAAPAAADGPQTMGWTAHGLRKSYVALASDMARWCGSQTGHRAERQELWRRIVFSALIRNLDDHPKNHGMLCVDLARQHWRLSPAFDLVPAFATSEPAALSMAYRYVPPGHRGRQPTLPRLVSRIDRADLLAAAVEHYGYGAREAADYLRFAAATVTARWRKLIEREGVPAGEADRLDRALAFAAEIAA